MEFHIDVGVDGGFVWRALDEAGNELVTSAVLASREACVRAILTFRVEAPTAPVFDLAETRSARPPSPEPVRRRKVTAFVSLPRVARRRYDPGSGSRASSRQRP
jgi:hypothetical protein